MHAAEHCCWLMISQVGGDGHSGLQGVAGWDVLLVGLIEPQEQTVLSAFGPR